MSDWSLRDKVVLVTGGARGIGAATAQQLSRRGAKPVLADLDIEALASTAAKLSPSPLTIELDVTDAAACEAAVERVLTEHGRLDLVWANAGIAAIGPMQLMDPGSWKRTIDVNLLGAYNTIRPALPAIIEQRGYVAVTASMASFGHAPLMSAYSATKAGVEAMCDSLRIELAPYGVDVATIHPTWIDTDMVREGEGSMRAFQALRNSLRPPLNKTYPLDRAVNDIVKGFERRRSRICTPKFVYAAHWLRPLLTTSLAVRDQIAAVPEMERLYREELADRGSEGAAVSERVAAQMHRDTEQVES